METINLIPPSLPFRTDFRNRKGFENCQTEVNRAYVDMKESKDVI